MLEVLMYLFENYITKRAEPIEISEDVLHTELAEAGFEQEEIEQAFDWLEDLEQLEMNMPPENYASGPFRVYHAHEEARLDVKCRGFILFLEQMRILDPLTREMVIDRSLALNEEITLGRLKWVTLVVLFNRPEKEAALEWLEDWVLNHTSEANVH